jgi:hypothetical protein
MVDHFNLLRIVQYTIQTFTLPTHTDVFDVLRRRKPVIGIVCAVHSALKPTFLSTLMIAAYGAKSYLALKCQPQPSRKILATGVWANERRHIDHVADCVGGDLVARLEFGLRYLACMQAVRAAWHAIIHPRTAWRCLKIVHRLNRRWDFMPACMATMALCYYFRFLHEIGKTGVQAVLTTSYYSPDGVALFYAARKLGRKTIYFAHAFTPPDFMPLKLDFDLAVLPSPQVLKNCQYRPRGHGKIAYLGVGGKFSPMRLETLKPTGMRVGIFLSAPVNDDAFPEILRRIQKAFEPSSLLVRPHPVSLTQSNLHPFIEAYPHAHITIGTKLADDACACDLALVGASTATLELLRMGLPCVYYAPFELIDYDYAGFIASGIALETKEFKDIVVDNLKTFYESLQWKERFLEYDPFYGQELDRDQVVRNEINAVMQAAS